MVRILVVSIGAAAIAFGLYHYYDVWSSHARELEFYRLWMAGRLLGMPMDMDADMIIAAKILSKQALITLGVFSLAGSSAIAAGLYRQLWKGGR